MTDAVLYRWKLKPGREAEFETAWAEGTRRIHAACGSYGAILHRGEDGLYWSYAAWPDEAARTACFADHDWLSQDCFKTMQACIEERFDEIRLGVTQDSLESRDIAPEVPVLTTDRLLLRPMTLNDAEGVYPGLSDDKTMTYWSSGPLASLEAVRDYLTWNIRSATLRCWTIAKPHAPNDALGWAVLMDRRAGVAEIGYFIRPDSTRQGYVSEAVERLLEYGFEELDLRRIYADTDPDNTGSIAVLTKLGFTLEGRLRDEWETHIGVRDTLLFGLLKRDRKNA
ncbi:GNAT family N-acetyltransferase [Maricaulis maris]|uniref:GNAT family N-acetyltransferase n=1 Tax=Maricaulis maris TaxID=74318 RepID=UPI003B8C113B